MKFLYKLSLKRSRSARLKVFLFVTIVQFALVCPLIVSAADNGRLLFMYGDAVNVFHFSPDFSGATSGTSGSSYSGVVDVYVPFYLSLPDHQVLFKNGLYHISSSVFGAVSLTLDDFGFDVDYGTSFGSLSLLSAEVVNSSRSFCALSYATNLVVDGVMRDNPFSSVSQYAYKPGSAVWSFRLSFGGLDLRFFANYSELLYLHLQLDAHRIYINPSVDLTADFTTFGGFPVSSLTLISESSVPGQIEDVEGAVNDVNETIKGEHQEEIDKADQAGSDMGSSLSDVTNKLSVIEILKLPWTMLTDLYNAINIQYTRGWTFPSFSIMGYEIWPSYNFSMDQIDNNFPVLAKSVRLASSFVLCFAFGSYIRRFFVRVFGSSESEED